MRGMGDPRQNVIIDDASVEYGALSVMEDGGRGDGIAGTFAASWLGLLDLKSEVTWAEVAFAMEVLDSRPPVPEGWDDEDELPFQCASSGRVHLLKDVRTTGDPVDLGGHERWRVRVMARNRSSSSLSDPAPQGWLLQFWPDPEHLDALAGPARRIAGSTPREFVVTDDSHFPEEKDVAQLVRWAPKSQPLPSVLRMAERLGVSRSSIRAGLLTIDRLVTQRSSASAFPAGVPDRDDEPVDFALPEGFGRRYDATATRA
jgi:hypothetical protein